MSPLACFQGAAWQRPPRTRQGLCPPLTFETLDKDPQYLQLFQNLSSYIVSVRAGAVEEPFSKKRKLDTPTNASGAASPAISTGGNSVPSTDGALLTVEGISFSVPARKKFNLVVSSSAVTAVVPASGNVEFGVGMDDIGMARRER